MYRDRFTSQFKYYHTTRVPKSTRHFQP
jgi:hypothetical protein